MDARAALTLAILLGGLLFPQGPDFQARLDQFPPGVDASDTLAKLGYLDVTRKPYFADPLGKRDSTLAIQKAIHDARDFQYVCFFPKGVYLVSNTISCEQAVYRRETPSAHDGGTQHFWGDRTRPTVLVGSKKGGRPLLKINPETAQFRDKDRPMPLVWVWAQSRDDVPGTQEPAWGKEQPNISFNQVFQGIDLDIRGFPGAAGIKHTGSQGCSLSDVKIHADGAFSGMINCPGQGGGAYNIEVLGGDYGLWADEGARFPMLAGLECRGQKKAFVYHAGLVTPLLVVGFHFEGNPECAVSLVGNRAGTGTTLVDGILSYQRPGGRIFATAQDENLVLENVFCRNVETIVQGEPLDRADEWSWVRRYARCNRNSLSWYGGAATDKTLRVLSKVPAAPAWDSIKAKHLWDDKTFPFFEDADAVNIKDLGAKGDGKTDETAVFRAALLQHPKLFVPRGIYVVSDTLVLSARTALFGGSRLTSEIRAAAGWGGANTPIIATVDDAGARTSLSDLAISSPDTGEEFCSLHWRAGRNSIVRNVFSGLVGWDARERGGKLFYTYLITGSGGGRWYAFNPDEATSTKHTGHPDYRKLLVKGTTEPLALYSLNTERIKADCQAEILDAKNVSIYYYKSEAAMLGKHDTQTPVLKISGSESISIYNMSGNVRLSGQKSMISVANSSNITVTCARSFKPAPIFNVLALDGQPIVPGYRACAYFHQCGLEDAP
ncbi:MAG: hypothetical protein J0L75_11235 [Spirochaetes bacterium]|nr:hypothetical protein [Spirochaetota bacterium]